MEEKNNKEEKEIHIKIGIIQGIKHGIGFTIGTLAITILLAVFFMMLGISLLNPSPGSL